MPSLSIIILKISNSVSSLTITNFSSAATNNLGYRQICYGAQVSCNYFSSPTISGLNISFYDKSQSSGFETLLTSDCFDLSSYTYLRLTGIDIVSRNAKIMVELSTCSNKGKSPDPVIISDWISKSGLDYGELGIKDLAQQLALNNFDGLRIINITPLRSIFTIYYISLEAASIYSLFQNSISPTSQTPSGTLSPSSTSSKLSTLTTSMPIVEVSTASEMKVAMSAKSYSLPPSFSSTSDLSSPTVASVSSNVWIAVSVSACLIVAGLCMFLMHKQLKPNVQSEFGSKNNLFVNEMNTSNNRLVPASKSFIANKSIENTQTFEMTLNINSTQIPVPRAQATVDRDDSLSISTTLDIDELAIAIPGYRALTWGTDFVIMDEDKVYGQGSTANILVGALSKSELITQFKVSQVAIKIFQENGEDTNLSEKAKKDFMFEIALISGLPPSPNIVELIGYTTTPKHAMVMKLYKANLSTLLMNANLNITDTIAFRMALDIVNGMSIIHKCGVLHLDLKPKNILVDYSDDGSFRLAICDFGFASIAGQSRSLASGIRIPDTVGYTIRYSAPEVFHHVEHGAGRVAQESDKKVDVYAFAISLYEIMTKRSAWLGLKPAQIIQNVNRNERPPVMSDDGLIKKFTKFPSLVRAVTSGWKQLPEERPSFDEIMLWLKGDLHHHQSK